MDEQLIWRTIDVEGESVSYFEQGEGRPLLLIHGFISSAGTNFGRLLPLLPRDCRVIGVDLAGQGWSTRNTGVRLDPAAQALRLRAFLASLNIDRVAVVGTSMGGAVAQHLALVAPDKVELLLLLSSLHAGEIPGLGAAVFAAVLSAGIILTKLPRIGATIAARMVQPTAGFASDWTIDQARASAAFLRRRGTFRSALRIMYDTATGYRADITAIAVPTLVVSAGRDPVVPARVGRRIAAAIPGARYAVLPRCRHSIPKEEPQAVARQIVELLRRGPHDGLEAATLAS